MAVTSGMFLFEVVVEKVNSLVPSRHLIIRSDFGDIFSLELKDPKTMHIVMPEPPPLPPDPPGKKKAKKPKPPKKGKKGAVVAPPPEPTIQSGQSVLFGSSAEFLLQSMAKCPLEVSLWSKEDNLTFIGSVAIPWDPIFVLYLKRIADNQEPAPVVLKEDYNIFEEGKAKMMAKIGMQVKLSFLTSKLTTSFRTLSEDPSIRKYLYTGINSKTTSYMCTLKTTDENFEENSNKIPNNFTVDKPNQKANKIVYADYKNANPGANLTFFNEGDYCCMSHADKPPESIYKSPETCPDIDHIIDYVRKIIVSCNDNMRMLTPQPTIRPRIKATDIDRLCYCKETTWPEGELADRFKKEALSGPCPLCVDAGKKPAGSRGATFDIANIRGPCGRADCKIAREIRAYIEQLVIEDDVEFNLNDLIGPCGSKDCTLAEKILEFLHHKGAFTHDNQLAGLSTQCGCLETMQKELTKRESCASICSKDCDQIGSDASSCGGPGCPYLDKKKVYNIYYFTVEHDFDKESPPATPKSTGSARSAPGSASPKTTGSARSAPGSASPKTTGSASSAPGSTSPKPTESPVTTASSEPADTKKTKFPHCPSTCPSVRMSEHTSCSKTMCSVSTGQIGGSSLDTRDSKCLKPECPTVGLFPPSPKDSNIEINFNEITNPCCVKSCNVADQIKDFIEETVVRNKERKECAEKLKDDKDPCYCDCVCTFKFSSKTTYCPVCGGYQCLGDDVRDMPAYRKPHPCPVYHKLYDKKYIKTPSPWPDEDKAEQKDAAQTSHKTSKMGVKSSEKAASMSSKMNLDKEVKVKENVPEKAKAKTVAVKKVGKFTANVAEEPAQAPVEKKPETKYPYPAVPKNMGWNWTAEDIPGMKPRPKWRPGAANKILVRRYRALREGSDTIAKKKRALLQRKKKVEVGPTLRVTKRDGGEYTVEMQVFKKYSKERLVYQFPYEERPPQTYTIGKTEAEKNKLQKQRERRARRETRRKSKLLQSTFRDKCQEICLKAYNQAIGILPLPDPNNPNCPCDTVPECQSETIDSCSCSGGESISSSDTDHDEWVIEFSPPAARWDPKAKHLPVLMDNECQYTYLDYKVKLLDKSGNPVPRFFKSHEGKMECSDLGGFWGPGKVWLEINKDGYIGPDERWVPMNFTGPDGMFYSAEEGFFQDSSGQVLKLGIDGYIDKDLKWVYYQRRKPSPKSIVTASSVNPKSRSPQPALPAQGKGDGKSKSPPPTESAAGGKSKAGEKKAATPAEKKKDSKGKNALVMNVMVDYSKKKRPRPHKLARKSELERKKLAKYCEIMGEFEMFNDIQEIKRPLKTNRASNTPIKMYTQAARPIPKALSVTQALKY